MSLSTKILTGLLPGIATGLPLGYAVSRKNPSLALFLKTRVETSNRNGRIDKLYRH